MTPPRPPSHFLQFRDFAREEFAFMHRYAMVLHTDQAHPHVHLVVSAYNREATRLNIRKADLRRWREQFARHLRQHGIEANATPSQIRGRLSDFQKDGIFRAAQRGESRVEWEREQRATIATRQGRPERSAGLGRIFDTAETVRGDWLKTSLALESQGFCGLAAEVEQFRQSLRVPKTREERAFAAAGRVRAEQVPPQLAFER